MESQDDGEPSLMTLTLTLTLTMKVNFLLPCRHTINVGVPMKHEDINPRWVVNKEYPIVDLSGWRPLKDEEISVLLDPPKDAPRKGRPLGSFNRITSAVEKSTSAGC
ncbi:hypothetical protein V1519DRAFT_445842 [Lipomyces tetrasporus]